MHRYSRVNIGCLAIVDVNILLPRKERAHFTNYKPNNDYLCPQLDRDMGVLCDELLYILGMYLSFPPIVH